VKRTIVCVVRDRREVGGGVYVSGGERGGVPLLDVPYPRQSGFGRCLICCGRWVY
jgi:hypothetical protein